MEVVLLWRPILKAEHKTKIIQHQYQCEFLCSHWAQVQNVCNYNNVVIENTNNDIIIILIFMVVLLQVGRAHLLLLQPAHVPSY